MKLDKAPWSAKKLYKKTAKHIVWVVIAAATGGAWILYFHDAPTIARDFFTGHAPITSYVFLAIMTFTTYWLAGRTTWDGRGDCIDCRQCVAVCPVGIDIRDGLQLECIGCSLCIDACDEIMGKIDRPKGLIAFDTDANVQRRMEGKKSRFNLIRPRTIIYTVLFAAVGSLMLYSLLTRSTLDMNVLRDRQPNYVQLSDGAIRNGYTIKVLNKATQPRSLNLKVDTLTSPVITLAGQRSDATIQFDVPADETMDFKIYIAESDISALDQKTDFKIMLTDKDTGETTSSRAIFISGGPK